MRDRCLSSPRLPESISHGLRKPVAESLWEKDGQGPSNCKDDKITMDIMMLWFGDYDNKDTVNRKRKNHREGDNNKATVKVKVTICSLTKADESLRG